MANGSEIGPGATRVVPLGHGRTLTVRPATPADAAGLVHLYQGLSVDDRYRRFFSAGPGIDRFVDGWVRLGEHGGLLLVAVVQGDGPERIVADAGYSLLPDGDGELGMTVAEGWRGWLGPYLLDALLVEAAARGVPGLEADVLSDNHPMRRLLAARGCALLEAVDVASVRAVIGARGRTPEWPGPHDGSRVLVEGSHHVVEQVARAQGCQVISCPGPGPGRPPCPALAGRPCPLVAGADAVVCALDAADGTAAAVSAAHRRLHPDVPVVVATGTEARDEVAAVLDRIGKGRPTSVAPTDS